MTVKESSSTMSLSWEEDSLGDILDWSEGEDELILSPECLHEKENGNREAPKTPKPKRKEVSLLSEKTCAAPMLKKGKARDLDDPRMRVKHVLYQFDYLRRDFLIQGLQRADLKASKAISGSGCHVNGSKSIYGNVPGVEVGDFYNYRMELYLIALHRQTQAGIDYIPEKKSPFYDKTGKAMSVAVSVISSGGYKENEDEGDTLIYTGQGGNCKGTCGQGLDQELSRGNLAMKNSCERGLAVRLIRGYSFKRNTRVNFSSSGRVYFYDGLYKVVDYYKEIGTAGTKVWKFKLVRRAGQKPMSSRFVIAMPGFYGKWR